MPITDIVLQPPLRQPRRPKPHVMLDGGWWFLVDGALGTWVQQEPITSDPRPLDERPMFRRDATPHVR